jgi:hypothetical protein
MKAAIERVNSKIKALDEHLAEKVCRICFCGEESPDDGTTN